MSKKIKRGFVEERFSFYRQKSTVEFKKNVCVALVSDIYFQNILLKTSVDF